MKLIVLSDIHANFPALDAALDAIAGEGYDELWHCGDAVGIGPHPRECVERLLSMPRARCVLGNHDAYLAFGKAPAGVSAAEAQHHTWTREQVPSDLAKQIAAWPREVVVDCEGQRLLFTHCRSTPGTIDFRSFRRPFTGDSLDADFENPAADCLFFGHWHGEVDASGSRTRYINPGSLGDSPLPLARFIVAQFASGKAVDLQRRAIPYDDSSLLRDYERLQVPDRQTLRTVFHGRRFAP